jgi:diazepam-binding inhibitor (GABA receptor modulator, acyl-CoA-binding protein)
MRVTIRYSPVVATTWVAVVLGLFLYFGGFYGFKIQSSFPKPIIYIFWSPFMANLKAQFDAAMADSKNLADRPDNATLLKIYSLYKQGSTGDNAEKKPGFSDMVGRAKWDAWNSLKGTSTDEAMQQYVDLIASLK